MVTQLPVPISFELPDGWQAAAPDEVRAPGAAFVALNIATQGSGFTANITVDGDLHNDGLTDMADESVRALGESARAVTVVDRREIGSPESPGLTQDLRLAAEIDGTAHELVQCQVYLTMGRSTEQNRDAVVRAVLTSTTEQIGTVLGDFRSFVRSMTPEISG